METLHRLLQSLDFSTFYAVEGRTSIADLFPPQKRCGVYVLAFTTGEIYVGQAIDVTRRFVQHRKIHTDIVGLSLRTMHRESLDAEERSAIWTFEQAGFHLRNILFTSVPRGATDFDLLMSPDDQAYWLTTASMPDWRGTRAVDQALRRKYQHKFQRFLSLPYAHESIQLLQKYVARCIPVPVQSELAFWSCSCLPNASSTRIPTYVRVNINWQEVLNIGTIDGDVVISWYMALTPVEAAYDHDGETLTTRFSTLNVSDHYYEPGGYDQIHFTLRDFREAMQFLDDMPILQAIRIFNLRLMQKGPCMYSRYHCMDLANYLLPT